MAEHVGPSLCVVMPVFNEEAAVEQVFAEWLPALRRLGVEFRVLAVNDGSTDSTPELLRALAGANPELVVHDRPNAGHGQSCAHGYRIALQMGADWILQLDSDGQCDARFLPALWQASASHPVVFGHRLRRDDGWARWCISRSVSLVGLLAAGTWVADANVPYRLMRRDALERALADLPADFRLVNVLLALRLQRGGGIRWIPIRFRRRFGGSPSLAASAFARQGLLLFRQLRRAFGPRARRCGAA